jgi:uncharacterized membrane protein YeaQ/YmgE (transglycosylase-associated protein family)
VSVAHFQRFVMVGAFAGWLGGMLLKSRGLGFVGNVKVGAIGACIGGVLASFIGLSAAGAIGDAVRLAALGLTKMA